MHLSCSDSLSFSAIPTAGKVFVRRVLPEEDAEGGFAAAGNEGEEEDGFVSCAGWMLKKGKT